MHHSYGKLLQNSTSRSNTLEPEVLSFRFGNHWDIQNHKYLFRLSYFIMTTRHSALPCYLDSSTAQPQPPVQIRIGQQKKEFARYVCNPTTKVTFYTFYTEHQQRENPISIHLQVIESS